MAAPRFAVDRMLGRLATWLRLLGYDAVFDSHLSGNALARVARAESRTILTRDRRLARRAEGALTFFIESDHFRAQLLQVIHAFGLDPYSSLFTRCARCNIPVIPIERAELANRVPPYVLTTQKRFVTCPRCRRVYWPATHYEHVRQELKSMGFQPPKESPTDPQPG